LISDKVEHLSSIELFEILKCQLNKKITNSLTKDIIEELEKRFFKKDVLELLKKVLEK